MIIRNADSPLPADPVAWLVIALVLGEWGTHAVSVLTIKPLCHGEPSMVGPLLDDLEPGNLLSWDRDFFSFELIHCVVRPGRTSDHA